MCFVFGNFIFNRLIYYCMLNMIPFQLCSMIFKWAKTFCAIPLNDSINTGILTGHIRLNSNIGLRDDPDCDLCGRDRESAAHFLCNCTGFSSIRLEILTAESSPSH